MGLLSSPMGDGGTSDQGPLRAVRGALTLSALSPCCLTARQTCQQSVPIVPREDTGPHSVTARKQQNRSPQGPGSGVQRLPEARSRRAGSGASGWEREGR